MEKHFNITVKGVVQGVFFRASTQQQAQALGLRGFVRNQRDGSVYIEAEGEVDKLDAFIQWCRQGPPRATVETCDVAEGPLQNFASFTVQR